MRDFSVHAERVEAFLGFFSIIRSYGRVSFTARTRLRLLQRKWKCQSVRRSWPQVDAQPQGADLPGGEESRL